MWQNNEAVTIDFAGQSLQLLASGACYWPLKRTLIVSDLHLEKGSYFALRGNPLPLADTRATLEKLQQEICRFQPETVICLGDNVHDGQAFLRMQPQDFALLQQMCQSVPEWTWVIGNHDRIEVHAHPLKDMAFVTEVLLDNLCLTHELQATALRPIQLIGHYHPKVTLKRQGIRIRGKCFSVAQDRIIFPAFGAYTGGLEITDAIYQKILPGMVNHYILFKDQIFLVK